MGSYERDVVIVSYGISLDQELHEESLTSIKLGIYVHSIILHLKEK